MKSLITTFTLFGLAMTASGAPLPQDEPEQEPTEEVESSEGEADEEESELVYGKDVAYLAVSYDYFENVDGKIVRRGSRTPSLIVCTRHALLGDDVRSGKALRIVEAGTDTGPMKLELIEVAGGMSLSDGGPRVYNWFRFAGNVLGELETDREYEILVDYPSVGNWAEDSDSEPVSTDDDEDAQSVVRILVEELPDGMYVDNRGELGDQSGAIEYGSEAQLTPLASLFDSIDVTLTPEIVENGSDLTLQYELGYGIEQMHLTGSLPGFLTLDAAIEGRTNTNSSATSNVGYSQGNLNARLMFLPGEERYYPFGARVAVGWEGDDDLGDVDPAVTAQLIATIPYLGNLAESWQEVMGFHRTFGPPFVNLTYVSSEAEVATVDQDRTEVELSWIVPLAETWDFNARWRYLNFDESGVDSEEITELSLTYFPGGNLSQGIRVSYQDGFRPAVGDIGSNFLVGYLLQL